MFDIKGKSDGPRHIEGVQGSIPKDKIGQRYGKLTVLRDSGQRTSNGAVMWECSCDCGNTLLISTSNVTRAKGCGCLNRLPKGVAAFRRILHSYKKGAETRGYAWELSDKDAKALMMANCVYCGAHPANKSKRYDNTGDFIYSGIDRVDNSVGYTPDNSVSCCKKCNRMKMDLGYEEWLEQITKIYEHLMSGATR